MRFSSACLTAVALAATPAVFAQTAPAEATSIDDIQISEDAGKVSILVKLSRQPASAAAKANGDDLVVELNGLSLAKLALEPPAGSMIRHVAAEDGKLTLSGAAFGETSTVIYRNAIVIEARLAEPALRGASLMPAAAPAPPKAPEPLIIPQPEQIAEKAAPPPQTPVQMPASAPAPSSNQPVSPAKLAKLDTKRCADAAVELKKDQWSIPALGDHALCLLDIGSSNEAAAKIDQLAAFAPEDWRVALGRAVLAQQKGDVSNAEIGYRGAAMLAPDADVRSAITALYSTTAGS